MLINSQYVKRTPVSIFRYTHTKSKIVVSYTVMHSKWLPIEESKIAFKNLQFLKHIVMSVPDMHLRKLVGILLGEKNQCKRRQKCQQSSSIYQFMRILNCTDIFLSAFKIHRNTSHLIQLFVLLILRV